MAAISVGDWLTANNEPIGWFCVALLCCLWHIGSGGPHRPAT